MGADKNWPEIPQMPKNLSAQIVCSRPKVWDFNKLKTSLGVCSLVGCINELFDLPLGTTAACWFNQIVARSNYNKRIAKEASL